MEDKGREERGNVLSGEIHVPFHGDGMEQSSIRDSLKGGHEMLSWSMAYAQSIDGSKQSGTVDLNRNCIRQHNM